MTEEEAWSKLLQNYAEFNVLTNIIEHTSEIEINRYKELGLSHDPKINRYHNHISFAGIDGSLIKLETKSYNIEERVTYLKMVENNQYKALLVDIHSNFKRFVISKYGRGKEVQLLIRNNCTNIYHKAYKVNLFHIVSIALILRNSISQNKTVTSDEYIQSEIDKVWSNESYSCTSEEKEKLKIEISKFIENDRIMLTKKQVSLSPVRYLPRINFIINCLLSFAYEIKK